MMHGREKSDPAIVAMKPANKAGRPAAESVERRAGAKGNANQQSTRRAQNRESVSQALDRVRQAARQERRNGSPRSSTMSVSILLRTAFFALKRDAAPGRGRADVAGLRGRPRASGSRTCTRGSTGERTGRSRPAGRTYRRRTGGSGRWRSPRWKTRSSRARWSRC